MAIENVETEQLLSNIKASKLMVVDLATDQGQATKKQLFDMVTADLSNPKNKVVLPYQMFLKDELRAQYPNTEFWGIIETTAEWAVLMYQEAINTTFEIIWWELENPPSADPPKIELNGVFDCDTAAATLLPAQIVRGTGVGKVDYWPLGLQEFNWCMSNSEIAGELIEYSNEEIDVDTFIANFQRRFEVKVPEDNFIGLSIPDHCEGIKPTKIAETKEGMSEWVWPIALGTTAGIILVGMTWFALSDRFKQPSEFALDRR